MNHMAGRKKHSAEDIVRKLRRTHDLAAAGKTNEEIATELEVSPATLYNWRRSYGGRRSGVAKRHGPTNHALHTKPPTDNTISTISTGPGPHQVRMKNRGWPWAREGSKSPGRLHRSRLSVADHQREMH